MKFFNPDQGPADPHQFPPFYGNQYDLSQIIKIFLVTITINFPS